MVNLEVNFSEMNDLEKLQYYVNRTAPLINKEALFADGTPRYRYFIESPSGYTAVLRFRTAKNNVQRVQVIVDDCSHDMAKVAFDQLFDYYEVRIPCGQGGQKYYFRAISGKLTVDYHKQGFSEEAKSHGGFSLNPGFHTPDWAKGAVFYQIFVDRFCNGDPSNDVVDNEYVYIEEKAVQVKDWSSLPKPMDVGRFYGGDLQGIMDKLDYLQELGVDVIYLNPIFVSPSNHKYDIQDYDYVDPHFGKLVEDTKEPMEAWETENSGAKKYIQRVTSKANLEASNAFFAELVEEIHRRGMRVILDGVFNHCGSFNKWMDRERIYEHEAGYAPGAFISEDSPYHTFFKFSDSGSWPYNSDYDGWWGHATLPKLNYEESPKLEEYILNVAKKWVSPPYNVDGWRLDVAADLGHSSQYNHDFWKKFRTAVKEANPEAIVLAEHYGDPAPWLQGDQWDTVMNYDAFMEPVTWFLAGVEKHSDEYNGSLIGDPNAFFSAMDYHMSRFHYESLHVAMNELSNHDHSRFLTRTNHRVGRIGSVGAEAASEGIDVSIMRLAVLIQMTWPGAPTIYYGDEAGVCGWTDPDSRRTYPWGHENQELIAFHKDIIRIHKSYEALKRGSLKFLGSALNVLAYGRFDETDQLAVILNNHPDEQRSISIPVWQMGVAEGERMLCLLETKKDGYALNEKSFEVHDGQVHVELAPGSGVLLWHHCE